MKIHYHLFMENTDLYFRGKGSKKKALKNYYDALDTYEFTGIRLYRNVENNNQEEISEELIKYSGPFPLQ